MQNSHKISREKHLDHMIKVVPFIVLGYALQCYVILQIGAKSFAVDSLIFLGFGLCSMIAGFITYDLHHKGVLHDTYLELSFPLLSYQKKILFDDIAKINIGDPEQNFSNITFHLKNGKKLRLFFVDDAAGIKKWIEEHQYSEQQLAA